MIPSEGTAVSAVAGTRVENRAAQFWPVNVLSMMLSCGGHPAAAPEGLCVTMRKAIVTCPCGPHELGKPVSDFTSLVQSHSPSPHPVSLINGSAGISTHAMNRHDSDSGVQGCTWDAQAFAGHGPDLFLVLFLAWVAMCSCAGSEQISQS
jgi:hypothetical protein